jgi:hypothetical protein
MNVLEVHHVNWILGSSILAHLFGKIEKVDNCP